MLDVLGTTKSTVEDLMLYSMVVVLKSDKTICAYNRSPEEVGRLILRGVRA